MTAVVLERDGARLQVSWSSGHPHWNRIFQEVKSAAQDYGGKFVKSKKCWEFALGDFDQIQTRLSLFAPVLGPNARDWQSNLHRTVSVDFELPALPYELKKHQLEGIRYLMQNANAVLADDLGLGKQQPVDTKVLTPSGWREIGDLEVGDFVIGSNGRPTKVIGVYPQGVKEAYRVTCSDGSSVDAGPEHLWTVYYWRGGKYKAPLTLTTQQLMDRPKHNGLNLAGVKLSLPMLTAPVQFENSRELLIPPYTLGAMIGNGSLAHGSPVVVVNTKYTDHFVGKFKQEGCNVGAVRFYGNAAHIGLRDLKTQIKQYGLDVTSKHKSIPRDYFVAPPEDRINLLRGLMDTDGSITAERNRVTYHTCSKQLAIDVQELVECLGGIASIRVYDRTRENKPIEYQVRIRWSENPFSLPAKADRYKCGAKTNPSRTIVSVEYARTVASVCIAVDAPDKLYVTEHAILTHNTIMAATAIHLRIKSGAAEKVLVVCPNSLKRMWRDEFSKCYPDLKVVIYKDETSLYYSDVVIINYEKMWRVIDHIEQWSPDMVVCDESHRMKTPTTQTARAIARLQPRFRIILSGTLLTNKPEDVWFPINWAVPGYFPDFWQFRKVYCEFGGWGGKEVVGYRNLPQLRERIRQIALRRTKAEVLDMPDRVFQVRHIEMTKKQRAIYEQCRLGLLREANDLGFQFTPNELTKMLRLAQIASNPRLAGEEYEEATAKYDEVMDIINDCDGPVIVFSCYRYDLKRMKEMLGDRAVLVHGEVSLEDRAEAVNKFQSGKVDVFLGSTAACREGLTLTAADTMVYINRSFNATDRMQSLDRNYRIGQHRSCTVIDLVVPGTVDELTYEAIKGKQAMVGYLQSQNAAQERHVNLDDLRRYLEGIQGD